MNDLDPVFRPIATLNPVPRTDELPSSAMTTDSLLATIDELSAAPVTTSPSAPSWTRRGWLIAATAALVVLVALASTLRPARNAEPDVGGAGTDLGTRPTPVPDSTFATATVEPVPTSVGNILSGAEFARVIARSGYGIEVFLDGLETPNDVVFDPTGGLFVAESRAGRVSRVGILPDGTAAEPVAVASGIRGAAELALSDDGVLYVSGEDGVYRVADGESTLFLGGFEQPGGLAIDADGDLYVADDAQPGIRITRVSVLDDGTAGPSTEIAIVPGHGGGVYGEWGTGDIEFGPTGELFIADLDGSVLMVEFTDEAWVVSEVTDVLLPRALAFDESGTLHVGTETSVVWSFEPEGPPTVFVRGLNWMVEGLAFGSSRDLYVTEVEAGRVLRIVDQT